MRKVEVESMGNDVTDQRHAVDIFFVDFIPSSHSSVSFYVSFLSDAFV